MTHLPFPALHASHAGIWLAEPGGAPRAISKGDAIGRAAETPVILMNAPLVGRRLGYPDLSGLDLLELFAFVHPARFMVPTPAGLARVLGLESSARNPLGTSELADADIPSLYLAAAEALLETLGDPAWAEREGAWNAAQALFRLRWPWAAEVARRIKRPEKAERWLFAKLPEWEERAPRPAPRTLTVEPAEVVEDAASLGCTDDDPLGLDAAAAEGNILLDLDGQGGEEEGHAGSRHSASSFSTGTTARTLRAFL